MIVVQHPEGSSQVDATRRVQLLNHIPAGRANVSNFYTIKRCQHFESCAFEAQQSIKSDQIEEE